MYPKRVVEAEHTVLHDQCKGFGEGGGRDSRELGLMLMDVLGYFSDGGGVLMLIYIDVASAVKSRAPGGSGGRLKRIFLRLLEFFPYVGWVTATFWRWRSTQVPRW